MNKDKKSIVSEMVHVLEARRKAKRALAQSDSIDSASLQSAASQASYDVNNTLRSDANSPQSDLVSDITNNSYSPIESNQVNTYQYDHLSQLRHDQQGNCDAHAVRRKSGAAEKALSSFAARNPGLFTAAQSMERCVEITPESSESFKADSFNSYNTTDDDVDMKFASAPPQVEADDAKENLDETVVLKNVYRQSQARVITPADRIGMHNLPAQIQNKSISNGFQFNVLIIGETGIGKTTLLESLFNRQFDHDKQIHRYENVKLQKTSYRLTEGDVVLKLSIIESEGFGDQINTKQSAIGIRDYIENEYETYLTEEWKIERNLSQVKDSRIHLCIYMIPPSGRLRCLDVELLNSLNAKVNIMPVIARADTLSREELKQFKQQVRSQLEENNINYVRFPTDEDMTMEDNMAFNNAMPMAVIASRNVEEDEKGRLKRVRRMGYGVIEVENIQHSDFPLLRNAILRINTDFLIQSTHSIHYENYRRERITQLIRRISGDESLTIAGNAIVQRNSIPPAVKVVRDALRGEIDKKLEDECARRYEMKMNELKLREEEVDGNVANQLRLAQNGFSMIEKTVQSKSIGIRREKEAIILELERIQRLKNAMVHKKDKQQKHGGTMKNITRKLRISSP